MAIIEAPFVLLSMIILKLAKQGLKLVKKAGHLQNWCTRGLPEFGLGIYARAAG
jgi:hypothetical protein